MAENKTKIKKSTVIRTIVLFITLVNSLLAVKGISPISFLTTDTQIAAFASNLVTGVVAIWTWWKNNSFTENAKKADEYKAELDSKK